MIAVARRRALALFVSLVAVGRSMLKSGRALAAEREGWTEGLASTLIMPEGRAGTAVAAVLIIAGSGPTDRDGNSILGLKSDCYKLLAQGLAGESIASLRYDKRGIAHSLLAAIGMSERDFTVTTFVDDAVRLAKWLKAQPSVGPVFLVGHSEGALIALIAAREADPAGVVLICGPGRKLGELLREQLSRAGTPPEKVKESLRIIAALERGESVTDVPPGPYQSLFRESVQPFLRSEMGIDPSALAASLTRPMMIIGGGADIQVPRADFDKLAAARPDATAQWFPDMTHRLKAGGGGLEAQKPAYTDPALPLEPGLVAAIAKFVGTAGKPG